MNASAVRREAGRAMRADRPLLALFVLVACLLVAGGVALDRRQVAQVRAMRYEELSRMSAVKAREIVAWRSERLGDAAVLAGNPAFRATARRWLAERGDETLRAEVEGALRGTKQAYMYRDVLLVSTAGEVLLSASPRAVPLAPEEKALAGRVAAMRGPAFGEMFLDADSVAALDVAARLEDPTGAPVAAVLLRTQPERDLFPLLSRWPLPSSSAETLLLRREGDEVVFLKTPRALPDAPAGLRKSAWKTQFVGARAAQGVVGVVEGLDYRHVDVLADLRPIPGSDWLMVSKVDRREILAAARYREAAIFGGTAAGIAIAGLFFWALAGVRRKNGYAALYRAERERRRALEDRRRAAAELAAAQQRFKSLFESVGEGIHIIDARGDILFVNPTAEAMFGLRADEMNGRSAHELVHHHDAQGREYPEGDCPIVRTLRDGRMRHVEDEVFFRADGTSFPVEYICAPILDERGLVTGTVVSFRDVSRRRAFEESLRHAQEALRSQAALLANAQRIGQMGSWDLDVAHGRLTWSDETCALFGIEPARFRSTFDHFRSFILPEDVADYEAMHGRLRETGASLLETEYRIRRPDGQVRWMYERGTVERNDAGEETRRLGMVMDITERKRVERQLAWEARLLEAVSEGAPLEGLLERIARGVEESMPGTLVSIEVVEDPGRLRHAAAPSLPGPLRAELDQAAQCDVSTSFGVALREAAPVIVPDLACDPLCEGQRSIASRHGLVACWSVPVLDATGRALACLTMYQREAWEPGMRDLELADRVGRIAGIAIERDRREGELRASEERFRRTFLDAATGIAVTDVSGRFLEANEAYCAMLGYTREELGRLDVRAVTHPEDWGANQDGIEQLLQGRKLSFLVEKRYVGKDGRTVWARVSVSCARDLRGPAQFIGVAEDITERKLAQRKVEELLVREREAREAADAASRYYRQLFEAAPGCYLVLTADDYEIVAVSEAFLRATMTTREALAGRTLFEAFPDDPGDPRADGTRNLRASFERVKQTLRSDVMAVLRHPIRRPDLLGGGFEERFWSPVNSPVFGPDGQLAFIIHRVEDVTDYLRAKGRGGEHGDAQAALESRQAQMEADVVLRSQELKRANEELARNQALLRVASQVSRLGAWAVDLPGMQLTWTDEVREIHEYDAEGTPSVDEGIGFYAPEWRGRIADSFAACMRDGVPFDLELQIVTARGRRRWVRAIGEAVRDASGRIVRVHGAIQDIEQRKAAERSLRDSEERFRLLARATRDAIWDLDLESGAIWRNDAFTTMFGFPVTEGERGAQAWEARVHPEDRARVVRRKRAAIESGAETWTDRYRFRRGDGSWAQVQDRGYLIRDAQGGAVRMVGAITDITEQQQLEERLRQAERLESVGQLTGGVAHDFNNLLTVILGSADLLEEELRDEERLRPIAGMIASAAARGAQLTSRLLAFARKQALSPRPVDVNQLVASLEGLLRRTLGEHIEIRIVPAAELRPALVDPGQLESALLNLCVNSRDAMGDGGRLEIVTDCVAVGEGGREVADLKPGPYVALRVADTGSGIAAEHLGRLFEPFFTTKAPGKGTGLGLAMVYGFAKQTGGHVEIASEAGRGTCVTLYLPCADLATPPAEPAPAAARSEGGNETILLVEDEPLVRKYAVQKLASLGYRVLVASHAAEALEVLGREGEVDLLFTDMVMPGGMSGRQLADEANRRYPDLKVLFTSGYAQDGIVHGGRLDDGVELLAKPYRSADLARRVRAVLDAR